MSDSLVPAIGIDLGTTNSCVAIYLNGNVEVLANDVGERTTPSYVAFKDDIAVPVVGKIAKDQAYRNTKNTIFDVKRLMGKKFNDVKVQQEIKCWPFTVIDRYGNPEFIINLRDKEEFYCPEQISANILKKLKDVASKKVEAPVTKAVITVPAYFDCFQRQATMDAGKLAGLEVLMLLNEPTAAAITYALDKSCKDCKYAMIFDLGGGTLDVSIVKFENRRVIVKAIHGDSHLGGNDFNRQLLIYLIEDIKVRFNYNIQDNPVSMSRLLAKCETQKQLLSFHTTAEIELFGLIDGKDYYIELTREKFKSLNQDLFEKTLDIVRNCLITASLVPSDIDNVVLVGGSTRIPRIRSLLEDLFEGKTLSEAVNPDEAVVIGAAIQAANLNTNDAQVVKDFVLEEVVPFSLGIEIDGGFMVHVIERNTLLPAQATKLFTTMFDDQPVVTFDVYEGQNKFSCNNYLLGTFNLIDIPPAPKGDPDIEVTFDIDINGILNVTALERSSKKTNKITITNNRGLRSKEELEQNKEELEK